MEVSHERQQPVAFWDSGKTFQHGVARDEVVRPHSIDGHDRCTLVLIGQTLKDVGHTFATSLGGQGALKWGCCGLNSCCHLFRHRPGDQSSEHVPYLPQYPECLRFGFFNAVMRPILTQTRSANSTLIQRENFWLGSKTNCDNGALGTGGLLLEAEQPCTWCTSPKSMDGEPKN